MIRDFTYIIKKIDDWQQLAEYLHRRIAHKNIILLKGTLGAGKTSFVQTFGKILQINEHIISSTFSIVSEYHYNHHTMYHFDLYRIEHVDELKKIGFEDYLYSGCYCFIEWPDVAMPLLKEHTELHPRMLQIHIEMQEDGIREANVKLNVFD